MAKKGTKKKAEAKDKPKPKLKLDKYGCKKGTASSLFAKILAEEPMNLGDARKAFLAKKPDSKLSLGKLVKQMVARGVAEINKEGLIHVKPMSS